MLSLDSSMNDLVKPWGSKHRQRELTHVLRRPVEITAHLGLWLTESEGLLANISREAEIGNI